jgi:hypothetical protein
MLEKPQPALHLMGSMSTSTAWYRDRKELLIQHMSDIKKEQLVVWYYSTSTTGTTFSEFDFQIRQVPVKPDDTGWGHAPCCRQVEANASWVLTHQPV